MAGRKLTAGWLGVLGLPCMPLVPAGRARFAPAGGWLILSPYHKSGGSILNGHYWSHIAFPFTPASGITKKLQLRRDRKNEIEPLNTEEVKLFLEFCHTHVLEH